VGGEEGRMVTVVIPRMNVIPDNSCTHTNSPHCGCKTAVHPGLQHSWVGDSLRAQTLYDRGQAPEISRDLSQNTEEATTRGASWIVIRLIEPTNSVWTVC